MALVLIVDDEPDTMLLLRIHLEAVGHRTILAADADTALSRLAGHHVDLVLVDVMMPVHDGWTVLEAVSKLEAVGGPDGREGPGDSARRPVALVVSGRAGRPELDRAERLGATRYLAKPFTTDELYQAVDRALAGSIA